MSKEERHIVSEEELYLHFASELSDDQQAQVLDWKSLSGENEAEYNRLKLLFLDLKAVNTIGAEDEGFDVGQAWAKSVRRRRSTNNHHSISPYYILRVAAMIVLMIGVGWFCWDMGTKSESTNLIEYVASGEMKSITLPDGTNINLSKNSRLIYSKNFDKKNRTVSLEGEAFFDVTHNPKLPFVVKTGEVQVRVLGTSFNVNNAISDSVEVMVKTGKVQMTASRKRTILTPGYRGVYYRSTRQLVKIGNTRAESPLPKTNRKLSFEDQPLSEILASLHQAYQIKVNLSNPAIANCKISISYEGGPIEEFLNGVGYRLGIVWSNQGDAYLLAGRGCPE
ncbi:MAG: FecR domain-containing protein [Reichenbachiella sp.]|uniref:FecR family protein n=1 Tax=Reichenbachiella sp. TaxID=2184521 RepID=UPI003265DD75